MISLRNVSKFFNKTKAVDDVTLNIEEGENVVLLGTSGCGKTTTLRMINRLVEASEGEIVVNGQNVLQHQPEELRKGIGYVLQHNGLFPHFTVAQNIAIVPSLLKWSKEKTALRTSELLQKLHLDPVTYSNAYPNQLSGGQQQRVGLARALAADPPILLLDEPFGALDPVTRVSIRNDFIKLEEFNKKTIVMVTHDIQEAFEIGNKICVMSGGKIIQSGTPAELLFKPETDFVKSFLHEHKFTLGLQSISIEKILNQLPPCLDNIETLSVSNKTNLLQLLQVISESDSSINISVPTNDNIICKNVTIELLLSLYNKFKDSF